MGAERQRFPIGKPGNKRPRQWPGGFWTELRAQPTIAPFPPESNFYVLATLPKP